MIKRNGSCLWYKQPLSKIHLWSWDYHVSTLPLETWEQESECLGQSKGLHKDSWKLFAPSNPVAAVFQNIKEFSAGEREEIHKLDQINKNRERESE